MFRSFAGKPLPMRAVPTTNTSLETISIYDPAMCCSTGLCSPGVDQQLLEVSRYLRRFETEGIEVERFNLAQQPAAFVANPRVAGLLQAFGEQALPVTLVNGTMLVSGRYASRDEIRAAFAQKATSASAPDQEGAQGACGCEPGSGCC